MLREKQPVLFNVIKSVHCRLDKAAAVRVGTGAFGRLATIRNCIPGMKLPIISHVTLDKLINHNIFICKIQIIFFLPPHKVDLKIK